MAALYIAFDSITIWPSVEEYAVCGKIRIDDLLCVTGVRVLDVNLNYDMVQVLHPKNGLGYVIADVLHSNARRA